MPKFKLSEFLLPWEHDGNYKKLDEPKEMDVEQLRKYVYGLLEDKEKATEAKADVEAELAGAKDSLTTMQREKETEAERRDREDRERQQQYEAMEKRDQERRKVEAIEDHFKDQGIEAARARRLAKRVSGDDEKAWIASADELVEDGFRLSDKPAGEQQEQVEERTDDLTSRPRPVRSDGTPVRETGGKKKRTVAEELEDAIPVQTW